MSEKMQWSEAEAVVRAYRAEQGASSNVDIATIARALGTNVEEVRRLAGRRRRFIDHSGVMSAMLAAGVAAFAIVCAGTSLLQKHPLLAKLADVPVTTAVAPTEIAAPTLASRHFYYRSPGGPDYHIFLRSTEPL